ncbi:AraC family transcriptional regulator [Pseudonocardia sp. CA-142604]|uniref:AraC family transcriptional regulator n=1 Tax=Pseudonocardia sp. CA-142604 TaxID=3240024 RepID=UPI003D907D47
MADNDLLAGDAAAESWQHTTDFTQAEMWCGSALYPHQRLFRLGDPEQFFLRQCIVDAGPITISDITFGADVRMDCGSFHGTYHVNLPLSGRIQSEHRGTQVVIDPTRAGVYIPDGDTSLPRWGAGSRQLCVKIDRLAVEEALAAQLEYGSAPVDRQLLLSPSLDITRGAGRDWAQLVLLLRRQLARDDGLAREPLIARPLVDALIHGLLLATDHGGRAALAEEPVAAAPAAIRAAVELIHALPAEPWTTAGLAGRCFVSVRSLQEGFKRHLNTSPMAYLRAVRLRHAHEELRAADPALVTVTSVATRWGFANLGKFAAAHHALYGENPRETLRRAR